MSPSRRLLPSAAALLVAAALLLGACSSGSSDGSGTSDSTSGASTDRQAVVTALVTDVIGPLLTEADTAVTAAMDASVAYCAAPSPETLQTAVDAVDAGIAAYERLDPVDMGPIMLQRTDGHVVYPVDAERLEELLAGTPATDVASINSKTPSSTRGLTAAEHLLASEPPPASVPVRCAFLVGVTTNAAESVTSVVTASFDGVDGAEAYYERLAGRGTDPENPKDVIDVVVNMMMSVLETDTKLLADPGDQAAASVRRAATAHMATIAAVWGDDTTGLSALADPELAQRVADEIAAAEAALADPSVSDTDALAAVDEVRASVGTEVVAALDVVVGFSENDGDS